MERSMTTKNQSVRDANGMKLEVGDTVRYYPSKGSRDYTMHVVRSLHPQGIPSCPRPLVMLGGKAGVILATHVEFAKGANQ